MSKGNKGTKDDKADMKPKRDIPKEIPPRQGFLALADRVL